MLVHFGLWSCFILIMVILWLHGCWVVSVTSLMVCFWFADDACLLRMLFCLGLWVDLVCCRDCVCGDLALWV